MVFITVPSLIAVGLLTICIWTFYSSPFYPITEDDQITIYSIDGRPKTIREESPNGEEFHGCPVLGKVEIRDSKQRRAIIDELRSAYLRRPSQALRCFIPRHAVRVVHDGRTTDFVICFQCYWFVEHTGTEQKVGRTISRSAEPFFNKLLTDANIPLAPN
jgi:hypothetical protein